MLLYHPNFDLIFLFFLLWLPPKTPFVASAIYNGYITVAGFIICILWGSIFTVYDYDMRLY